MAHSHPVWLLLPLHSDACVSEPSVQWWSAELRCHPCIAVTTQLGPLVPKHDTHNQTSAPEFHPFMIPRSFHPRRTELLIGGQNGQITSGRLTVSLSGSKQRQPALLVIIGDLGVRGFGDRGHDVFIQQPMALLNLAFFGMLKCWCVCECVCLGLWNVLFG